MRKIKTFFLNGNKLQDQSQFFKKSNQNLMCLLLRNYLHPLKIWNVKTPRLRNYKFINTASSFLCKIFLYHCLCILVDILPDNTLIQSPLIKLHNRTVWSALPLKTDCSIVTNFTQWTYDQ